MVDILCPHCEEEISLDDDASGEFACPYCGGEFEWNVPEPAPKTRKKKVKNTDHNPNGMFSNPVKIVNAVLFVLVFILIQRSYGATYYTVSDEDNNLIQYGLRDYVEYYSWGDFYAADYSDEVIFGEDTYNNECIRSSSDIVYCNNLLEYVDFYKGFNRAGAVLGFMLWFGFMLSFLLLVSKTLMFLDEKGSMTLGENWLNRMRTFDYIAPIIISVFLIFGNLMFILLKPNPELIFYTEALAKMDTSFTAFPFIVMVVALIFAVSSIIRVNLETN